MFRTLAVDLRLLEVDCVVGWAFRVVGWGFRGRRGADRELLAPVRLHLLDDALKFEHQGCRDGCCDELRSREDSALEPGGLRHCEGSSR